MPGEAAYLWDWYLEFSMLRGSSGFGPAASSWSDMMAWAQLTGRRLSIWQTRVLASLDICERVTLSADRPPETTQLPPPKLGS